MRTNMMKQMRLMSFTWKSRSRRYFLWECSTDPGQDSPQTYNSRQSGSIWAGGHNGKCPPGGSRWSIIARLICHYLDLHHQQRGRQTRRYPLRTSNMKMFNGLLLQMQNRWKWVLVILMVTEVMMKMMAKTGSMKIRVFIGQCCENVLHILDRTPQKPRLLKGVRMSLCCKSQWKCDRARLGLDGQGTRHLTRASFL